MNRRATICLLLSLLLFSSCFVEQHGYYLSPQNGNSSPYHNIPMKADSIHQATCASVVLTTGLANDFGLDKVKGIQANVTRSYNFGSFQAFYSADFSMGSYKTGDFYNCDYIIRGLFGYVPEDTIYHIPAKTYSYGGYGVTGGINLVLTRYTMEWRVLGVETSRHNEFGNYADFRNKLPDSAANIIFRKKFTSSMGIYTDICWKSKHHVEFGIKIGYGFVFNPANNFSNAKNENIFPLEYFSQTFHVTKDRIIFFLQANLATYADNLQFGMSFRLNKK